MHINQIEKRLNTLKKASGLRYSLGTPAEMKEVLKTEATLNIIFPQQMRQFYLSYNGITVEEPPIEIAALSQLKFIATSHLYFATVDKSHSLYLDVSTLNAAGQWDICVVETNYRVTLTLASFWSNKLWAWVEKKRPIWQEQNVNL